MNCQIPHFPLIDIHLFVFYQCLGVYDTFLIAMVRYILVISEPTHVFGLWEKPRYLEITHSCSSPFLL